MSLDPLLQRADIWRGRKSMERRGHGVATEHAALDAALADGGWPDAALTEIISSGPGTGELELLMPTLRRFTQEQQQIAWVNPPQMPYAPALARKGIALNRLLLMWTQPQDSLWTAEQSLRLGACAAVLLWPQKLSTKAARRLQLAAETGGCLGFVFRKSASSGQASSATLRLAVQRNEQGIEVSILKQRGGWPGASVLLRSGDAVA